jgi:hypothetical protein
MCKQETIRFKLAVAGIMACTAITGILAPASASAAIVTGNATITIDNNAFSAASPEHWYIDRFFNDSYNNLAINSSSPGGTANTAGMLLPVNSNLTTSSYPGGVNRSLQATTMDASNTGVGQIGLSGGFRMFDPTHTLGLLAPYDFSVQKFNGVWNLVSHDNSFGGTTFLQLVNANESVNSNGELSLSGDLIFGGGLSASTYQSFFGLTWSAFLHVPSASQNTIVGSFSLTPAAVPVPAAVWLFGSGLIGLLGAARKKALTAA